MATSPAAQWDEWVQTEAGTRPNLSRYELGELLGEGGTARVFRATERTTGEVSAIKILRPELCRDATAVQKFIQESQLLIELDCRGWSKVYGLPRKARCSSAPWS